MGVERPGGDGEAGTPPRGRGRRGAGTAFGGPGTALRGARGDRGGRDRLGGPPRGTAAAYDVAGSGAGEAGSIAASALRPADA
ncbi:hypothetical protein SSP531S_39220 [Streptomyces spongiicola]|uniref:Uncharacterized protein n=1 Tax=Streptomyces spongiicola TaxID=1690221 RepID=A0A388T0K1_9ACTN|nr:hypothetical protein SSP531S_39220 [Streptomyces spongiicola]